LRSRFLLPAALLLGACSNVKPWVNPPLVHDEEVRYDGFAELFAPTRAQDVLVVANFSGGGSRAAAFSYAVLSALDAAPFAWEGRETTLAREVDMVTGVSGGSVAAAHLALHGAEVHLARFPADFLEVDFQGRLTRALISPRNWWRESSPWFRRGRG
jgi:NTE family protein